MNDEYNEAFDSAEMQSKEDQLAKRNEILIEFGIRLQKLADDQVAKRTEIETRWLEDLRAYHGKYDETTLQSIRGNNGSEAYINLVRNKCNAAESRLSDMLFPSDDRNWGLTATPNPDFNTVPQSAMQVVPDDGESQEKEISEMVAEEAGKKAKEMQREIDDQLTEADYAAKCREALHDAVVLGTGIIKGPVVEGRLTKRWSVQDGVSSLVVEESLEPTVEVVSPWDYFPDMQARNKSEMEFEFERRYMTRKQVQDLLKLPNIISDQVRSVLSSEVPDQDTNDSFSERRTISGDTTNVTRDRYILWEYHGWVSHEELEACGFYEDDDGDDLEGEEAEPKEKLGINGTVFILNGRVIRVSLNPLDTEESPYSVFNWEKDSNSVFGYGVPFLISSPQRMLNAAARMMLDNAKLSVAPQIIMNKKLVSPEDGTWQFAPYKRWLVNDQSKPISEVIKFVNVPSNQRDIEQIYNLSRTLIDEQSSLPAIATGEGDPNAAPQTATGVAIASGSAKIVFKRVVKNFDDNMTVPLIKRFYDWNMQYNERNEIKGDMQVNALGTTSMMIREQEAHLMADVIRMIDPREIMMRIDPEEAITKFFKSRNIPTSNILRPEEEVEREKERQAQDGQMSPEMQKMQFEMQKWQAEAQQKEQEMMLEYEIAMAKMAADQQITVEQLKQRSGADQLRTQLEANKEANRMQLEQMKLATQRQIAGVKAQQENNKQMLQRSNLESGYDTF